MGFQTQFDLGTMGKSMRSMLLFLAVGLLVAADHPKKDKETADELRGIWVGIGAVTSGKAARLESIWDFKEDKIVLTLTVTTLKGRTSEWKYRADPKMNPKEIDLTPGVGPSAGKTLKGIYKIEKNILTICYVRVGVDAEKKDRPSEFDAKKRDDVVILTFERKKP
jgi:uncharacterized protein (TIGR03067 family)